MSLGKNSFPDRSVGKESACNAGDAGRKTPGGGTAAHPSILAWRLPRTEKTGGPVYSITKSQTQLKRLSVYAARTQKIGELHVK